MAKEIGMSKPGLYLAIEKERLTVDNLEKIAKALDVPITSFFSEEQVKNAQENITKKNENEILLLTAQLNESKYKTYRALVHLIRMRLKTSIKLYNNYLQNMPELKPGSPEQLSSFIIQEIFTDTYNEVMAAISFNETLSPDEINLDYLIDQKRKFLESFPKTPNSQIFNDKLNDTFNKLIILLDLQKKE